MSVETNNKMPSMIEDKLYTVKYNPDSLSHLVPDQNNCKICTTKSCTYFCPASVYHWDNEQTKLLVGYENCFECGACRIGCDYKSIEWRYPKASTGVTFKAG